ncbi:MAG: hypothetical protein Q9219_005601 [cf. Caloplaca sp. 3 TL-2023]
MSHKFPQGGHGRGGGRDRGGNQSLPYHTRGGRGDGGSRGGQGAGGGGRRGGGGGGSDVEVFSQGPGPLPGVDANIKKIENDTAMKIKQSASKNMGEELPLRPGFGAMGREVLLWTNYFKLASDGDLTLYRYSIDIGPDVGGRVPKGKKAKRIVQLLLEEHLQLHQNSIATDYKSNIISRDDIEVEKEGYLVTYRVENEDDAPSNAKQYRVRLQATGVLTVSELINYLTSSQAGLMFSSKEEIIQALNIVVGHHPKAASMITTVGANRHFDRNSGPQDRMSLGAGLQAIRGLFVSVRAATARILVNVQVKNMAFYDEGPLDGIMRKYMQQNGPNKLSLANFLKKLSIDVTHIARKNRSGQRIPRIKTIQGLATKDDGRNQAHPPIVPQFGAGAKEVQFYLEDAGEGSLGTTKASGGGKKGTKTPKAGPGAPSQGRYTSVYDFFQQRYSATIKDPSLPVVAAELNVRKRAFDINVTPKLITVPGRVLATPDVKYSGSQIVKPRSGSWNMQSKQFVTKADLPRWTYLRVSFEGVPSPWQSDNHFHKSMDDFQTELKGLGMGMTDNYMKGIHISVDPQNLESEIDTAIHKFAKNEKRPTLILVVVPEPAMTPVYNRVKSACDIKEGMLNVCVLDRKFKNANNQYFANVGLKFNLKLGGRNHSLDPAKMGILREKKTMVVGIDVTHPAPGSSSNAPSVAGIVASTDEWLGQWPADLRIQAGGQEMVDDLDTMFKSRLRLWETRNRRLPENIIVYRDGVSEGQYNLVLQKELPTLRKACEDVYPATMTKEGKPHMTIAIVGKRHNTRFYPTKKEEADGFSNPQNGTVVDRGVTEARNWDFYLQAHTAIQGTARPAHYYIVYDQIFRERKVQAPFLTAADAFEDLTHNLCYLFGRATKAWDLRSFNRNKPRGEYYRDEHGRGGSDAGF